MLLLTSVWNVTAEGDKGAYEHTLVLKIVLVAVSGATAYAHAHASSRRGMAVFGTLTRALAPATLFVGVLLAG